MLEQRTKAFATSGLTIIPSKTYFLPIHGSFCGQDFIMIDFINEELLSGRKPKNIGLDYFTLLKFLLPLTRH